MTRNSPSFDGSKTRWIVAMMRCVILLSLAMAATSMAQEFPKPTEAGQKALDALIARCVEAGGLARSDDPKTGRGVLSVLAPANLSQAFASPAITKVALVRDALVARIRSTPPPEQTAWITLLPALALEFLQEALASRPEILGPKHPTSPPTLRPSPSDIKYNAAEKG